MQLDGRLSPRCAYEALESKQLRFGPLYSSCFPTKWQVRASTSIEGVRTPTHSVHVVTSPFSVSHVTFTCSLSTAKRALQCYETNRTIPHAESTLPCLNGCTTVLVPSPIQAIDCNNLRPFMTHTNSPHADFQATGFLLLRIIRRIIKYHFVSQTKQLWKFRHSYLNQVLNNTHTHKKKSFL